MTYGDLVTAAELGPRRSNLSKLARKGIYVRLYSGVYARTERRHDPWIRLRAAALTNPTGYFVGAEVFTVVFGVPLGPGPLTMTGPNPRRLPTLRVIETRLPADWSHIRHGLAIADPALAAAFLAGQDAGAGIDRYLRAGGQIAHVRDALPVVARWGHHAERLRVVAASRAEPWSWAEREYHQLLWRARIDGWIANFRVRINGSVYFIDIAFWRERVAVEIDGIDVHSRRRVFEQDRVRQNDLVLTGWLVLRFTVADLNQPESIIERIRAALQSRRREAA